MRASTCIYRLLWALCCTACSGMVAAQPHKVEDQVDLFVINADGSELVRLTDDSDAESSPAWSPDATKVVFAVHHGLRELYLLDLVTGERRRLTDTPRINESFPAWHPEGEIIAYSAQHFGRRRRVAASVSVGSPETSSIQLIDPAGNFLGRITDATAQNIAPAFSPDGKTIAFVSNRDEGRFEIYVMNADGTEVKRLVNNSDAHSSSMAPVWLHNGAQLTYRQSQHERMSLVTIEPNGGRTLRSDPVEVQGRYFVPSPDGTKVVYAALEGDGMHLFVSDAGGSNATKLTSGDSFNMEPVWSRDGRQILFVSRRTTENR